MSIEERSEVEIYEVEQEVNYSHYLDAKYGF